MDKNEMRELAIKLAKSNVEAEPEVERVLWFYNKDELRLVEVLSDTVESDRVMAFRFGPDVDSPVPTAIALVRPEEVKKIPLPDGWGDRDAADGDWMTADLGYLRAS